MLSTERRKEIAMFLRTRRARLAPEEVGLPRGRRRRTPGLRREEVAALAGVSAEWYKWLEQSRDVRASEDALRRIAAALRLEPGEAHHLLTLSGYHPESDGNARDRQAAISPTIRRLLDQFEFLPAWVLGERWDVVAWNRAATFITGDIAAMQGIERNVVYQMFLGERLPRTLVDWEAHARDCVAKLRLGHARRVDDPWFNELVHLMLSRSKEFAAMWDAQLVQLPRDGVKHYHDPDAGRLTFDYIVFDVSDERMPAMQLVLYLPAPETDTLQKMKRLSKRSKART